MGAYIFDIGFYVVAYGNLDYTLFLPSSLSSVIGLKYSHRSLDQSGTKLNHADKVTSRAFLDLISS